MYRVLFWFVIIFTSCSSSKNVSTNYKEQELRDSISILTTENNKLFSENLALQYASISFDTLRITDTVDRFNTVTITKEGEIRTIGRVKEVKVSNLVYTRIIDEKNKTIDSLRFVKNKTIEKTVEKEKKVSFIPFWVWLIIIGLVVFNFRKQILSIWNTFL